MEVTSPAAKFKPPRNRGLTQLNRVYSQFREDSVGGMATTNAGAGTTRNPHASARRLGTSAVSEPSRRFVLVATTTTTTPLALLPLHLANAAEMEQQEPSQTKGLLDGILSIFDQNETTKNGKTLPKAYLKAAREVVKSLRESVDKDPKKQEQEFREAANSARDAIREYLSSWKGSKTVESQDSYKELEKALRELGKFYTKSGPTASLPEDVKSTILDSLRKAENDL